MTLPFEMCRFHVENVAVAMMIIITGMTETFARALLRRDLLIYYLASFESEGFSLIVCIAISFQFDDDDSSLDVSAEEICMMNWIHNRKVICIIALVFCLNL